MDSADQAARRDIVPMPRFRDVLAGLVILTGLSVLVGWLLGIGWLKTVLPGLTTMKANTAAGLVMGGSSLMLMRNGSGRSGPAAILAFFMGAIGGLTLMEYLTGLHIGIDQLLVADPDTTSRPFNGRMSPATAGSFVFASASLTLLALGQSGKTVSTAHILAGIPAAVGLLALSGYVYGVEGLYSFGPFVSVALHTGLALLMLSIACLATRSAQGWERPFVGRPIAHSALLQIALVSIMVPFVIGLFIVVGTRRGLYQAAFSPALFATATAITLAAVAVRSARILALSEDRLRAARQDASTNEERFRLALASGRGIGTWDWDVGADRVISDERFATLYGVDPELARAGAPIAAFFGRMHADDSPRISQAIEQAMRTGEPFSEEYRLVDSSGGGRWVIAEGRCGLSPQGEPLRFPGVSFDITDRKIAEAHQLALLQLSDKLRDLSDPAEMAFEGTRILGETLEVSRAGYGLVDKVAETILVERDWNAPGIESLAGLLHFRDYGSYIENLKRGETVVINDAKGDPRTNASEEALKAISATAFVNMPLIEQGGFVALLYANHEAAREWRDDEVRLMREVAERVRLATERVRAEVSGRTSEEQFRVFAQAVPNHIWAGRPDGYLEWFNDRVYSYSGDVQGSLDGIEAWSRIIHADDLQEAIAAWTHSLATGEVYEVEFRIRRADGHYRWFLVRAEPVRADDGSILRWVGTNTDIDDRRRQAAELASLNATLEAEVDRRTSALILAEEQLRQSQKMEAVGQLTGGLAHDFNNLLTGVMGNLELLEARVARGRIDDLDRFVSAAQGAGRRAAALTQRLLAFSRRQTLDPRPIDVNRLIAGMEDLLRRTLGSTTDIEIVGAAGLWIAMIDAGQLENALLNLAINGRDAMPAGGKLTIETANKWIDDRTGRERDLAAGQYLSICVTDTGTGMDAETIARAFEPFYTTKPMGEGTGLGLSMIYGFARQSEGQVRIYSEVGKGTTVCIYLPRYNGAAEIPEEFTNPDLVRDAGGQTVLVVDDEATIRHLIDEVLDELGYTVIGAADGVSGLKVLQSGARIDLLITDVGLPNGMNGRQVADAARVVRPNLKILFITGFAENAAVGNGHLEPGMELLTKPFTMKALATKVGDIFSSDR